MENTLKVFNNNEFGDVRVVMMGDELWFAGKDLAENLGYKNTKDALSTHVDVEDKQILQRSELATLENHVPKDKLPMNFVDSAIPNR